MTVAVVGIKTPQLLKFQTQASASLEFDVTDGDKCALTGYWYWLRGSE